MAGKIRDIPHPVTYPSPLKEMPSLKGMIVAQEMKSEMLRDGEYMRIIELVKWEDETEQLRFGYYYRKKGAGDKDWTWGQNTANMSPETFKELLKKAKENPSFKDILRGIKIEQKIRRFFIG
ncbi:MAG TPA: hypothetical protein ENI52_02925 [Thermoplasmata archaeon]|nr:hypothetical protein [Thermoplasmata archaeon]